MNYNLKREEYLLYSHIDHWILSICIWTYGTNIEYISNSDTIFFFGDLLRWSLPWSFRTWWCFYHSSCIPHKSTQLILHLMLKYCIGSGKSSSQGIQCWRKVTQVQKTAFVLSWLQSLSGKYQVRFPAKSLLPNSEEVLSFSIYGITQSFLKFWYRKCSP